MIYSLTKVFLEAATVIRGVVWIAGGSNPRYSETAEVALLNQLEEDAESVESPQAAANVRENSFDLYSA